MKISDKNGKKIIKMSQLELYELEDIISKDDPVLKEKNTSEGPKRISFEDLVNYVEGKERKIADIDKIIEYLNQKKQRHFADLKVIKNKYPIFFKE